MMKAPIVSVRTYRYPKGGSLHIDASWGRWFLFRFFAMLTASSNDSKIARVRDRLPQAVNAGQ